MCLAITGKVVQKDGNYALVDFDGVRKRVKVVLTPEVREGDWVIVHAGFSIQVLDEKEAKLTIEYIKTLKSR